MSILQKIFAKKLTTPKPRPRPQPRTQSFEGALEFKWLKLDNNFTTLIDIGANDGSFGKFLQEYMEIDQVIAFEPLDEHQAVLNEMGFKVHQMALGNENGVVEFTVNSQNASSSILPMSEFKKNKFPELSENQTVEVPIRRLDDVLNVEELATDILLKIDTEGFEDKIITGGEKVFCAASAIIIEMSFVTMYEGQALFNDIHAQLSDLGFQLTGFKDQICTTKERRPLFSHCVYQRQ